jgi:putative membrane-bound dehydrogenase-like protein
MPACRAIMARTATVLLPAALVSLIAAGASEDPAGPPYAPADSMKTMQLGEGFRIALVASEPDVQSPVAMDIDEDGRLFVVEMPGYPLDVSPTGKVKLLEDRDGDGRFERVTVFADGLVLPTGVMRWKKGVLVTAAPDVLYFEDTDGDGRADVRKVVLTGFARTNPQHAVNTPIYGLDNWIYVAHQGPATAIIYADLFGDRGKPLTFPDRPDQAAVDPRDSTVRFRPDAYEAEPIGGESQYGHSFDAYGRYFGNDNSHHLWHAVIGARYLRRNPDLLVNGVMQDVPDHGAAAQVFPITKRPTFELLTEAGEFTSACTPTLYLGGAFGGEYESSAFEAEPVHNLVHRDVLSPAGATFTARRGRPDREFLAAGDAWFRPVQLYVGPDGAIYVVDYYRARIEHPEWTSSATQRDPRSMYEGQDRGRIYRISREVGQGQPAGRPSLGSASDDELVTALSSPNIWWRRTAQRLLVTRGDRRIAAALKTIVSGSSRPLARLHAMWTLEGLSSLDDATLARSLEDSEPGIRENAVQLAEMHGGLDGLDTRLATLASDPDARVRFQVLATLGGLDTPAARAAHERLLFAELEDSWMQIAGLSAGSDRAGEYFDRAMSGEHAITAAPSDGRALFVRRLTSIIGARQQPAEIAHVIALIAGTAGEPRSAGAPGGMRSDAVREDSTAGWRAAALEGLAEGGRGRPAAPSSLASARAELIVLAGSRANDVRTGALHLLEVAGLDASEDTRQALARAERVATTHGADAARRADAVMLLSLDRATDRTAIFQSLVSPREPESVQTAAVKALGSRPGRPIGTFLLARWGELTPAVRSQAASALLDDEGRSWLLVDALKSGAVPVWALNFDQKRRLIMNPKEKLRAAARSLLEEDPRQRGETVKRYAAALDLTGDASRGAQVFSRACAVCHAIGGKGGDLGPDLATVRHRPPLLLLGDILLPSQSIAQKYETYMVERTSGTTDTGVVAAQTPTSITLRQGPGQAVTIARSQIRKITVSPRSTMPADLDKQITPEEMADLLAFLTADHASAASGR